MITPPKLHHGLGHDPLTNPEILEWYKEEESGYYDLVHTIFFDSSDYKYEYYALNSHYAARWLSGRVDCVALAMGCARGDDIAQFSNHLSKIIALEPAEKWWSEYIGGVPTEYRKPHIYGDIELPSESVDVVFCFGVLHHIPNLTHILEEIHRVLRPGGLVMIREPIHSMGDWRKPRRGLTKNERGVPVTWLDSIVETLGFRYLSRNFCMFPLVDRLCKILHIEPYNSTLIVKLDAVLSKLFSWNIRYFRTTLMSKAAPWSIFCVLEKAR